MVPISEGVSPILLFMLLIDRLLHSSAVTYSVNCSEMHKGGGKPLPKLAGCIAEKLILVNMKLLLCVPNLVFLAGRRLIYGIIGAARGRAGLDFTAILSARGTRDQYTLHRVKGVQPRLTELFGGGI
jgi:hypothetical protein